MIVRTPKGKTYNFPMTGLKDVLSNLNNEIAKIENIMSGRLIKAILLIRRAAQKKTPVQYGNLRNSAYTLVSGGKIVRSGDSPKFKGEDAIKLKEDHSDILYDRASALGAMKDLLAEIGFTAYYAVFVHEIQANHKTGEWKFLENAIKENKEEIISILKGDKDNESTE